VIETFCCNGYSYRCDSKARYKDYILGEYDGFMQHEHSLSLPMPDTASAAHSERVASYIRDQIHAADGRISFAEFMQHALYAPGLGYYAAGAIKFGAAGDFVTAPEISPVFGRVLARQCAEVLANLGAGSILEFGAGSGKLAVDMLRALGEKDALPETYKILEVSADLRQRQEQRLKSEIPEFVDRCVWVDEIPLEHNGVIVANEVLDALPVERFVRRSDGIKQLCVSLEAGEFVFAERAAPARLLGAVAEIEADLEHDLPIGFVSEVSLAAAGWIADVGAALKKGMAFFFDYGVSRREYYAADRSSGWLRCHFRHHAHNDPLLLPGIQDLTAWVDFSAVAGAGLAGGLEVVGYVSQAQFLLGGGLEKELQNFADLPTKQQVELSGQIKILTLPAEMGENFKCLALSHGIDMTPTAFSFADRTMKL
jgi:SAM-dependent MidA family methyltransferase